jgi:hypothetical protein
MEFPGSSNQHLGRDRFNGEVGCGNNCSQTGEEFSNEPPSTFLLRTRRFSDYPQEENPHNHFLRFDSSSLVLDCFMNF